MRQVRILLAIMALLSGCGLALAGDTLTLSATIGFGGYYRPHTLVPIAVNIKNAGDTMRGELRVTCPTEQVFAGSYVIPVTIPRGANQLRFLYVTPQQFAKDITVEFWNRGEKITTVPLTNCQELYDTGRLLVVAGGSGASFSFMGAQTIHPSGPTPAPRPWDFASQARAQYPQFRGGMQNTGNATGVLSVAYVDRNLLPDNPEAYGSIGVLALMSDTTENNLPGAAQEAIPLWVASGGHLLVGGGGIAARLQAPFFTRLLPLQHGQPTTGAEVLTTPNGGQAVVGRVGAGYVTALNYDPDLEAQGNATAFYQQLFTRDPSTPAAVLLQQQIDAAIMVRNLQPPNLSLIIVYLLVYLVILVPVNYFVLKKLDKREMAWVTTPVIVVLFTLGAYGIGYATKGNRLVLNQISVLETSAGQSAAEAVSELLIFSPARTSYDLDLGETGLLATEVNRDENTNYRTPYQQAQTTSAFSFIDNGGKQEVHDIGVNMWDFRQLAMTHTVSLQGGFAAQLTPARPGATPRATGTVTNNTPFHFENCALYCDGVLVSEFPLDPQQTVTVEKMANVHQMPSLNADQQHIYETLQPQASTLLNAKPELSQGFTLLGYTTDVVSPVHLSGHAPSTNLSLFVVHLQNVPSAPVTTTSSNLPRHGMQLWLRADAIPGASELAPVTSWKDNSGNGRNAIYTRAGTQSGNFSTFPRYMHQNLNGKPVVHFDGNSLLQVPSLPLGCYTIATVFRTSQNHEIIYEHGDDIIKSQNDSFLFTSTMNTIAVKRAGRQTGKDMVGSTAASWAAGYATGMLTVDQFGGTDESEKLFINGQEQTLQQSYTGNLNSNAVVSAHFNIGERAAYGGNGLHGDIAEIVVYDHILSTADRQALTAALMKKYGIASR